MARYMQQCFRTVLYMQQCFRTVMFHGPHYVHCTCSSDVLPFGEFEARACAKQNFTAECAHEAQYMGLCKWHHPTSDTSARIDCTRSWSIAVDIRDDVHTAILSHPLHA